MQRERSVGGGKGERGRREGERGRRVVGGDGVCSETSSRLQC